MKRFTRKRRSPRIQCCPLLELAEIINRGQPVLSNMPGNGLRYKGIHVTHQLSDGTKIYRGEFKKNKIRYRTELCDSEVKAFNKYKKLHVEIHGQKSKYFEMHNQKGCC